MTVILNAPRGVQLVGSVPLSCAEEVFRKTAEDIPGRLRRVPDGETGVRQDWVQFQRKLFADYPMVKRNFNDDYTTNKVDEFSMPEGLVNTLERLETSYDTCAVESYALFCRMRKSGTIAAGVRFQVSMPTAVAVVGPLVSPPFQAIVEPYYEKALLRSLRSIQDQIPAHDLAIQFDIAVEIGMLEGVQTSMMQPWFEPITEGIYNRIQHFTTAIDTDVQLGFHLCYGDLGAMHFIEPKDTQLLVEMANRLVEDCAPHKVNWFQLPVPKDRDDDAYFAPLAGLRFDPETELYLGLVHPRDESGTKKRITAAAKFVAGFGVATECGMGRMGEEDMESIFEVSAAVAEPWD